MDTNLVLNAGFNELVFENRNKNYGAYQIRRRYRRNVLLSALIASGLMLSAFATMIFSADKAVAGPPKEGPHVQSFPVSTKDFEEPKKKEEPKIIEQKRTAVPPAKGANPDVEPTVVREEVKINHPADTTGNPKGVAGGSGSGPIVDTTAKPCIDCDTMHVVSNPPIKEWVTDPPTFKGDIDQFFGKNIKYPPIAKEGGVQGTVWLSWVVDTDGKVTSVEVVKGSHPLLDREALRVAQLMPNWNPGKDNGKPVRFRYRKPIRFVLQ